MAHIFAIDETYLTQALVEMVQINSSNPLLTPGAPGEAEIGAHIAQQMKMLGTPGGNPRTWPQSGQCGWNSARQRQRALLDAQWTHGYGRCRGHGGTFCGHHSTRANSMGVAARI